MGSICYSFLDDLMTEDDDLFFKQLGQRIASLRKEGGLTQVQLAKQLEISQQHMAAIEAGRRKATASNIPVLAQLFGITTDKLLGLNDKAAKRGPASILHRQIEQIGLMPRAKQKFITEMLEALIKQQQTAQG